MFGDDSDEDEKRVVRSQKDKRYKFIKTINGIQSWEVVEHTIMWIRLSRFDELRDLIRSQKNSMKIKDITKVQTGTCVHVCVCGCANVGNKGLDQKNA